MALVNAGYSASTSVLSRFREAMPHISLSVYLQSPLNAQRRLRVFDPTMPKDPRLFYESDSFCG